MCLTCGEGRINAPSCELIVEGCMDVNALNYNEAANTSDESCEYPQTCSVLTFYSECDF